MGGSGSGWRGWSQTTVESCLVLSAVKMMRDKMLYPGLCKRSSMAWVNNLTGEPSFSIELDVNLGVDDGYISLHYTAEHTDEVMDYRVQLTTTPLPWGGLRWWFICPLMDDGGSCGRRVGKLYLPRGGQVFGCRHCYDLTYTSCQEAHKFDACFASVGAPMGLSARKVAKLLSGKWDRNRRRIT